jgi:hypothetical protein
MTDYNEMAYFQEMAECLTQPQVKEQPKKEVNCYKYANICLIDTLNEEQIEKICDFMIEERCFSTMDSSYGEPMFYAFYDSDFEDAIEECEDDNKEMVELLNIALDFMSEYKIDFLMY